MSEEEEDLIVNDLSFLEDIDIDGIVEYLNETDNILYTKRKEYDEPISQDSSQNKKIKINTIEIRKECTQITENGEFSVDKELQKVNITIKKLGEDSSCTNVLENDLLESNENIEMFLNLALTYNRESVTNSNNNNTLNNASKLVQKSLEKNQKSSENIVKQITLSINNENHSKMTETEECAGVKSKTKNIKDELENVLEDPKEITLSINDENVKIHSKMSETEECAGENNPLLSEPKNIRDELENVLEDPKDDNKTETSPANKPENFLDGSNKNIGSKSFKKPNNSQENAINISKNSKHSTVITPKLVKNEDAKNILLNSNKNKIENKPNSKDSFKENKLDASKRAKLSTAISVVIRKDDLCLAVRLQKRLYEFLNVTFSDINIFHYGRYSKIFECQQKGKKYALKVINPDLNTKQFGTAKGKMLNKLQQSVLRDELNFIYLFASFGIELSWCFLFDFYPTNLREELQTHGPMHIATVENLSRQLITALHRLRSQHIIHSDIKPEHILLNASSSVLKVCGFDRAYHMDDEAIVPNIGTPSYRAPEVILGYSASFSIDMWASGLVLYEMMTDKRLFPGCFNNDILFKQMCLLGNMPLDMIENSIYGANHFVKNKFLKREGHFGKDTRVIYNFSKNYIYKREPYRIYNKYWKCATSEAMQVEDIKKITTLVGIIDKMLVLHPDYRVPIEVLYDDPFMLKSFCL